MKFFIIFALSIICSPVALSQAKAVLEFKAAFEFRDPQDRIWWSKTLDGETKLVLVGQRNIQLLDIENAKLLESRPIKLPDLSTSIGYDPEKDWVLSPDGRKMLIIGHRDAKVGSKYSAWIWDLPLPRKNAPSRVAILLESPSGRLGWR